MGRADVVRKAMGKKKQAIMDEEAPHFIEGSKELNIEGCIKRGISRDVAMSIWKQMNDFAKYAFNKSHAAAYAAISMQTAYLKANYPLEFAVGLLTSVMDDSDKLMKYVNSFRQMGISVLPPDVCKSEYGFTIEDEDKIRFGLFAIKKVGVEVAKRIPKDRKEKPYEDLEDFITRHIDFNKAAFISLAKAGALDSFGYTRHTLNKNLNLLIQSIKKERNNNDENQLTLFDFGIQEAKICHTIKNFAEYSFLRLCRDEKEVTGMYISGHPASYIEELSKTHGSVDIAEINCEDSLFKNNDAVSIGSVITKVTRKITKNGNLMMIVNVEDQTGAIDVILFEAAIQKYASILQEGNLIFVRGKVRGEGEDSSIFVDKINELKEIPSILWIATDDSSLFNLKKMAVDFQTKNPGLGDYLYIVSRRTKQVMNLGDITVSDDMIKKAQIQFGYENVRITKKKQKAN